MKQFKIKFNYPLTSVIRLSPGAPEALNGSVIIEAEDKEFARDEFEYTAFNHPLAPTHVDGSKIKPIITSIEEVID